MTTIDLNTTRVSKLTQAEKDYWVRTYSSCPEWCDSVTHTESGPYYDGSIRHSTAVGSTEAASGGYVHVTVAETIPAGEEYCPVVVELEIDVVPGSRLELHQTELAAFADEFASLMNKASALVTSITQANDAESIGRAIRHS